MIPELRLFLSLDWTTLLLVPASTKYLAGPFPTRAVIFFRLKMVCMYFTMFTLPAHLSEQHYLAAPAWGTATRDLLRCCCGTSHGFAPSHTASAQSTDQSCVTKIRQDDCLIQDYSRRSSASRRAALPEYHWTFAVAKTQQTAALARAMIRQ